MKRDILTEEQRQEVVTKYYALGLSATAEDSLLEAQAKTTVKQVVEFIEQIPENHGLAQTMANYVIPDEYWAELKQLTGEPK